MENATELNEFQRPGAGDSGGRDPSAGGHLEGNLQTTNNAHEFSLPRADGGKDAWLFLVSCFFVEALVWGFLFSFGVFQEYYTTHEPFASKPHGIAAVGTTATGLGYISGIFLFPIYKKWPLFRKRSIYAGIPLLSLSLVAASFANEVWQLILTQGIMYGIGGAILYYPTFLFLDEWFIRRKGFAFGVMWAGTGAAGLAMPFILSSLLEKYGFRATLRIWATASFIITIPMVKFLRPRLPVSSSSVNPRFDLSFLKTPTFWLLQMGNIFEGLGYFVPQLYLPTYSASLNLETSLGPLLVSLANTTSVLSAIIAGILVDKFHVTTVIFISTVGATASVHFLWGFATSRPPLIIFALSYGLFAGGFSTTYAGVIKAVKEKNEGADLGIIVGLLSAGRGIGAVASGPLTEALLRLGSSAKNVKGGYESDYMSLIVFTGVTAAVGGVSFLGRRLGWM